MHYLFVYGTLKRGKSNSRFLKDQTFIGKDTLTGNYKMFNMNVPFIVQSDKYPINTLRGELYSVTSSALKEIDKLEGHPYLYRRSPINVVLDNEETVYISETYLMPLENIEMFIPELKEIVDY
jgi:gamma-glutamylcyclotransferase (GGCT)/AIG2-like uncharacterized protein YtfP